jgi:hypothetical protein
VQEVEEMERDGARFLQEDEVNHSILLILFKKQFENYFIFLISKSKSIFFVFSLSFLMLFLNFFKSLTIFTHI